MLMAALNTQICTSRVLTGIEAILVPNGGSASDLLDLRPLLKVMPSSGERKAEPGSAQCNQPAHGRRCRGPGAVSGCAMPNPARCMRHERAPQQPRHDASQRHRSRPDGNLSGANAGNCQWLRTASAYRSNRKRVGFSVEELPISNPALRRKDVVPGIRVTPPKPPVKTGTCSVVHVLPVKMACAPNQ